MWRKKVKLMITKIKLRLFESIKVDMKVYKQILEKKGLL